LTDSTKTVRNNKEKYNVRRRKCLNQKRFKDTKSWVLTMSPWLITKLVLPYATVKAKKEINAFLNGL
jgi:hypothetical protein